MLQPAPNLREEILRYLEMHGVGHYASLNHILRKNFPADTTIWGEASKSAEAIKQFLSLMQKEDLIELDVTLYRA